MKNLVKVGLLLGVLTLIGTTIACESDLGKEHRTKAAGHFNKKEYDQAIQEFDLAIQADPNSEKTWKEKAFVHQQIDQHEKAAEALLKYVELTKDPKVNKEAMYHAIATEYKQVEKFDEAEKVIRLTMDLKPTPQEKASVLRVIADMYLKNDKAELAEERFNEALKLDPKDTASLGWLAAIYSRRGGIVEKNKNAVAIPEHLNKAIEYLDQMIAIDPDEPAPYINKRIVINKFMQEELEAAKISQMTGKKGDAAEHKKKADEYKAKYDELTAKYTEVKAKAKAAAPAPAPAKK